MGSHIFGFADYADYFCYCFETGEGCEYPGKRVPFVDRAAAHAVFRRERSVGKEHHQSNTPSRLVAVYPFWLNTCQPISGQDSYYLKSVCPTTLAAKLSVS